ncbi:RbsD/FucU family protein [Amphibiibacter pelophylacis]|uniref:RbsD/FucU domain-containing protein n=1 Tax=Amphibiibacter pelophylacis TaxID=1799477 RepID=A0ACC6P0Y1_9BURK
MLKGISPLLIPDLLALLCDMGHGDEIIIADANFTARSLAQGKPVVRLPGAGVLQVVQAVMPLFPLDRAVDQPVTFMQVCQLPPGDTSQVQRDVIQALAASGETTAAGCQALERFAFYERCRSAFAVIHTGEMQPYANFILKKGVIADALA